MSGEKEAREGVEKMTVAPITFNFPAAGAPKADDDDSDVDIELVKSKKNEEKLAALSPAEAEATRKLLALQKEREDLGKKFEEEKKALEAKYEALYQPLYQQRSDVVVQSLPNFWSEAIQAHPNLRSIVEDQDKDALSYLQDVKLVNHTDGFELQFTFRSNPYFTNTVLTKRYFLEEEDGETTLDHSEGCEIQWQPSKNLTQKMVTKKQRHKSGRGTRTVTRAEPCDSFFNFFSPPKRPSGDDDEEEDVEEIEQVLEADYDVADDFKNSLLPYAVEWFTGAAMAEAEARGFMEMDDDEDDDDDEDGHDHDDDDDDDDDEEPRGGRGGHGHGKGGHSHGKGGKSGAGGATQVPQQKCEQGQQ